MECRQGERGHNDQWGGDGRGDRTGRGIARRAERHSRRNPSTSGFTGKPALVLDRPGGIPQGYGLTSRRSVTEPRWVSSPPSYCATAPLMEVEAGAAIYRNKRAEGAPYAHPPAPAGGRGLPHPLRGAGTGTDRPRAGPRQLAARAYGLMSSSIADWGQKGQREAQNSQD